MGRLREAEYEGQRHPLGQRFRTHQLAWAINGVAVKGHVHAPLLAPSEKAELAFVPDNPGDWMLHCHVLANQAGGMIGAIRVV